MLRIKEQEVMHQTASKEVKTETTKGWKPKSEPGNFLID